MVFKGFFDGGNQADSKQYDVITLASVSGTITQWKMFERGWRAMLQRHHAPWLHTTDAISLKHEPFTKANGWNTTRRDAFLTDCAMTVENHMIRPAKHYSDDRDGLIPYTVTVVLKDFIKAQASNPELPSTVEELCATQAVDKVHKQGSIMGAHCFHLVFDQNEPFMGHILDRQYNRKARRVLRPITERITSIGQVDMRLTPALQAADLLAWCISHKRAAFRFKWQTTLLGHSRWFDEWFDYDALMKNTIPGVADTVKSWKLPRRKPPR